ncbi:MAG TPA: transketolase [Thermoplasmata archaeon]|nr:transketolase [Thermoplasmata archaeon]
MSEVDEAVVRQVQEKARAMRRHILTMTHAAQSGHPGGSLSATDLVASLYFHELRVDPQRPDWPDRDRFILSKGHACPAQYGALAERGFFPVEELLTFRKLNSRLQGHPELGTTPGLEACAGAEGQGLSVGIGMALAARLQGKAWRVYVIVGDGENDVGETWEAAMAAPNLKLDNLVVLIDRNGIQQEGRTEDIMPLEPLADKWRAFGWHVLEIDGHDVRQVLEALAAARAVKGRPVCILARTVKGKGVSFMENVIKYHGAATTDEELSRALAELEGL